MAVQTDLSGKVAIVTGAGRGIGRAIALSLGQAGADCVCVSRTESEIERTASEVRMLGPSSIALSADIAVRASVEDMVARVIEKFKRVDILINNAGTNDRRPALEVTDEQFDRIFRINVRGTFLCSQVVGRQMIARGSGRIVNVASMLGLVATENTLAYGSSKAAVIQMTRVLALELSRSGINVNAIAPGGVHTRLTEQSVNNPEFMRDFLSKTPMGRLGTPAEIASAALFLCSDAASYMNGSVIVVDGGYTSV